MASGFRFGRLSRQRLAGVHPDLVRVVERALALSTADFSVVEGVRTIERQRQLVREGKSQTLHSRHLGGFAVDLCPWVGGRLDWDTWEHFDAVAAAMKTAAAELEVPVRWGGCWLFLHQIDAPGAARKRYGERCRQEGRAPFVDAVHFELCSKVYPA